MDYGNSKSKESTAETDHVESVAKNVHEESAAERMYSKLIIKMRKCSFEIGYAFLHIVYQGIAIVKLAKAAA